MTLRGYSGARRKLNHNAKTRGQIQKSGIYTLYSHLLHLFHTQHNYTVKKIDRIPGLVLIESSWDCVNYFQRPEFYRKCSYIPGQLFSLLRM
jgi:hypothetical protein